MQTSPAKRPLYKKWWFYPLLLLLILALCGAGLLMAVIVNASRLNAPSPADTIIVLGAQVYQDGSPSPALQRRLDLAYDLYGQGYAGAIITTGAQGDNEPMPEGDAMRAYLIEKGVPAEAIHAETNSYNTVENLEGAKAIMQANGLSTAIIVSSDYHLWRALSMAEALGIPATGAGSQNALTWFVTVRNWVQESLSWVKYLLTR